MSVKARVGQQKIVSGHWFASIWGSDFNPDVIEDVETHDIPFEYSLQTPGRGRNEVRGLPSSRSVLPK